MTYQAAEDTFLLLNSIKDKIKSSLNSNSKICEVGCGSGEIISNLQIENPTFQTYATDINPQAIEDTKKLNKNINTKVGSFLQPFSKIKFDTIIFNTPYLPVEDHEKFQDLTIEDKALYGGTIGCEVTNEFIDSIHSNLSEDTIIYILISSLTKPNLVEENILNNGFEFEIIAKESHFFEELIVYEIKLSETLKYLIKNQYKSITRFSKGKHSYILQAKKDNKTVMIKFGKEQHISKEIFYLEKLQNTNYAAKLVDKTKNSVIYEKIEGIVIFDFFKLVEDGKFSIDQLVKVTNSIFNICFDLDKRGISKDEMTRPHHHIFINPENIDDIKFIDFERSTMNDKYQNSRQFLQYVIKNSRYYKGLNLSQKKAIEIGKEVHKRESSIKIEELFD